MNELLNSVALPPMPPEIASGVNKVCTKAKIVVKDHRNTHGGGYAYASVDSFYEDMGPMLAEEGLFIVMNEAAAVSDGKWLMLTFHIYIFHTSGKAFGPIVRTQGVLANGPQAYAAAQSYAEKYFLRQLFKIPTGEAEADADSQKKEPIPVSKKPDPDYSKERDLLIKVLQGCADVEALDSWGVDNANGIKKLPKADYDAVSKAFADHKKQLQKEAA